MGRISELYQWMHDAGDERVKDWLLLGSPIPIFTIYISYLILTWAGPRFMKSRNALNLKYLIIIYNVFMVSLSAYMCYEFFMSAYLAKYSLVCQPVDYSNDPLALRMANVCWWYFFSKVIELLDTAFFVLKKNNRQITFLHVYHHSSMLINWWLGANYIAGGQSFFLAMVNTFVHVFMYSYYALAGMGPHMQKYLWWKKYITKLQLTQFVIVIIHMVVNCVVECSFPKAFNYVVIAYAISLILLFSNFYNKAYSRKQKHAENNGIEISNGDVKSSDKITSNGVSNGVHHKIKTF